MANRSRLFRTGYEENIKGFGQLLRKSKPLDRALRYEAVQLAWHFRNRAGRGRGPGPHSADQVKVFKRVPGGRKKDRMEMMVVAYGQKNMKNASKTLREGLIKESGGRKISRRGRVSA
ncbi:hypothetical protein SEA_PATIO_36 [Gordonia phage Patio]|uniref:Uncharacterized protein n=1 Tax=Gordonia phage Patio TaxID=2041515 RepID=A0A2D2W4K6_9CAUD|nr:head-tail connector protein [Gordonia phage Patio]ATS93118.1 hypothetical protein SEA_PATIO_36 [Gordonia phage Patio]